jgi:hypothetical protein
MVERRRHRDQVARAGYWVALCNQFRVKSNPDQQERRFSPNHADDISICISQDLLSYRRGKFCFDGII